jgi:Kef-type K+ transport system membrane component KefB
MGILLLSIVVALANVSSEHTGWQQMLLLVVRITVFFAVGVGGATLLGPFLRWTSRLGVSQAVLAAALVVMCGYAWMAEYIGAVAAITGAYLAGVVLARTSFKDEIDRGIHPLTYSMFVPMFFISIGLQANARELGVRAGFTIVLVLVAIVAKMLGSGTGAWLLGFSRAESVRVGIGMISRGEVGLIVAGYGLSHHVITRDVFSASVMMVLVTTMVTPPLLRMVFPRGHGVAVTVEETIGHNPDGVGIVEGTRVARADTAPR